MLIISKGRGLLGKKGSLEVQYVCARSSRDMSKIKMDTDDKSRRCDYKLNIFMERLLISFSRERFFLFSMDRSSRFSGPSCQELGGDI